MNWTRDGKPDPGAGQAAWLAPTSGDRLDLGPYAGLRLEEIAVMDPGYLLALIREAVGPAELRAAAARELALRGALFPPESQGPLQFLGRPGNSIPGAEGQRKLAPWALGVLAGLLLLGLGRAWDGLASDANVDGPNSRALSAGRSAESVNLTGLPQAAGRSSDALSASSARSASEPDEGPDPAGADAKTAGFDPTAPCGARVEGAVPAEAAADFLDTFQAVEMPVVGTKDTGKVTFLNSHDPYQGHFYVAIFPGDYARYPEHPARYFKGRCILVQGSIEAYRGTPQIVLRDPADVRVLGEIGAEK